MRQLGKNVRGRNRGGRRGNSYGQANRHTTFDSNGPGVRLRGNALQLYEKYVSLGNEASAAGERITAEAHYQHADHYFRTHSTLVGGKPAPTAAPATPATAVGAASEIPSPSASTLNNGASNGASSNGASSNGASSNGASSNGVGNGAGTSNGAGTGNGASKDSG